MAKVFENILDRRTKEFRQGKPTRSDPEGRAKTSIADYSPEKQKNIKNYFKKIGVSQKEMEKTFLNYSESTKRGIVTGRTKGAPSGDNAFFINQYKKETLPLFVKELNEKTLELTKKHTSPTKIKSELYKYFNNSKYTEAPEGVMKNTAFFNLKEKRFNFLLGKQNNTARSAGYLNQIIATNIMKNVKGDANYNTALSTKKFYIKPDKTPLMNRSDMSIDEKRAVRKFRKQYKLYLVESGAGGFEKKTGKTVNSPWLDYTKKLKFTIGKSLNDYKKITTVRKYIEQTIKNTTDPKDVKFFEGELEQIKNYEKVLVPGIRQEFPDLFDGVKINNEHKIARVLIDEGTVPLKYLTKTTPVPSFFNAIKYKEFDKPLIDLVYDYNDALPEDRPAIKTKIENLQKDFNNKTKVGGKGYLDSVKFNFGPKGVTAKDTTPSLRKGDFGSQLNQNIKHSNAYLKNLDKKSIVIGGRNEGGRRYQIDKLIIKPPKNFETAVQALGCRGTKVRLPNKSGGIQTTDCYKKGLEKIRNKQVTDPVDARNMRNVAKTSTMIARTGGAAKVAAILGPAGIGVDILFEGAVIGNEVLKGKPFEEAWGRSFISYLGPNRQDPDELEMDRSAGDDPKAQSYVQDVRLENEFYKNYNLYKAMEANDMAYTRDEVLSQMDKTQTIYDQIDSKYEDTADSKTDSLAQISKQTGSDGSMNVLNKDTNYRAFEKGQEREAALEGERSVNTTLFGVPINQMTPMKSDALRRQKITDIFEDRKLVGQKMKPEVKAQGMLDYELLKSGAIPGIGYMAEGGLANLTTTVAPQSGPNSKGLESLRKYATKTY